jgi:hypothetical protein
MSLISQPGSDYQLTRLTLDAGNARDIMLLLLDVHAVLDHLYLDGTQPQITVPAEDYLRESASPYTLPTLIGALDDVITMLGRTIRDATPPASPDPHPRPAALTASAETSPTTSACVTAARMQEFDKGRGPVGFPPIGQPLACPHGPIRVLARVPLSNSGTAGQLDPDAPPMSLFHPAISRASASGGHWISDPSPGERPEEREAPAQR